MRFYRFSRLRFRVCFVSLALLVFLLSVCSAGHAQVLGELKGRVADASGAAVIGARVTLTQAGTAAALAAVTTSDGEYDYTQLNSGVYSILIQGSGFASLERKGVTVTTGQTVRLDLALKAGSTDQTVTVTGDAPPLQAATSDIATTIPGRVVVALPLNSRNFIQLTQLAPGVELPPGTVLPRINGGRPRTNEYLYDGISALQPEPGQVAFFPIVDGIAEFTVEANNVPAEFGRFNGGVVNVATRSGGAERERPPAAADGQAGGERAGGERQDPERAVKPVLAGGGVDLREGERLPIGGREPADAEGRRVAGAGAGGGDRPRADRAGRQPQPPGPDVDDGPVVADGPPRPSRCTPRWPGRPSPRPGTRASASRGRNRRGVGHEFSLRLCPAAGLLQQPCSRAGPVPGLLKQPCRWSSRRHRRADGVGVGHDVRLFGEGDAVGRGAVQVVVDGVPHGQVGGGVGGVDREGGRALGQLVAVGRLHARRLGGDGGRAVDVGHAGDVDGRPAVQQGPVDERGVAGHVVRWRPVVGPAGGGVHGPRLADAPGAAGREQIVGRGRAGRVDGQHERQRPGDAVGQGAVEPAERLAGRRLDDPPRPAGATRRGRPRS